MIKLTEKAKNKLFEIMKNDEKLDRGLRIAVKGGGCSGLSYSLEFQKEPATEDRIFEVDGIKIFLDLYSAMYLQETELDFSDGLNGSGFSFRNPNAKRTCGCGQSFST